MSKLQSGLSERDSNAIFDMIVPAKEKEIDRTLFEQIIFEYDYDNVKNSSEKLLNDLKKAIVSYNISIFETFKNFDLDHVIKNTQIF